MGWLQARDFGFINLVDAPRPTVCHRFASRKSFAFDSWHLVARNRLRSLSSDPSQWPGGKHFQIFLMKAIMPD